MITDRAMPAMTGDQLAARLHRDATGIPVVLMTGFGALLNEQDGLPASVGMVVSKPLTLEALRHAVTRVIPHQRTTSS